MLFRKSPLSLGLAVLLFSAAVNAETIAVDNTITVKEPSVPSPARGMTMEQVESKFGQPTAKQPAVGKPPITRWDYPGFAVYFEFNHVVHTVALSS
jgi:ribonucleotide monophosphatase NagD (HAD superfamily)